MADGEPSRIPGRDNMSNGSPSNRYSYLWILASARGRYDALGWWYRCAVQAVFGGLASAWASGRTFRCAGSPPGNDLGEGPRVSDDSGNNNTLGGQLDSECRKLDLLGEGD